MKPTDRKRTMKSGVASLLLSAFVAGSAFAAKTPVDYVNPYMGNISHLLMPTFPTVHLPNGMMRVYPVRGSYTESRVNGLPLLVVNHRECQAFNLSATQSSGADDTLPYSIVTDYDNEEITPYYYATDIDGQNIRAEFTPAAHSAVYRLSPDPEGGDMTLILNARNGEMNIDGRSMSGYQYSWGGIKVYIYAEVDRVPVRSGVLAGGRHERPDCRQR